MKRGIAKFTYSGEGKLSLGDYPAPKQTWYKNKKDYKRQLRQLATEIDAMQSMMYAHDRYAMLIVFQAMDAAGKDGTIAHVMRGINPHGIKVHSFKRPSEVELDHGFLWRTNLAMPERGRITIFNRSYYEEVLVAKVHPSIVTDVQRIPGEHLKRGMKRLWRARYKAIRDMEAYLHSNGTRVVKFFLNVSKDEQKSRFLARIDEPAKNWKFSEGDVAERKHWGRYMDAYSDCIAATATPECPWYIVPADDKKAMRLMVSTAIAERMRGLDLHYPKVSDDRRAELAHYRKLLQAE